MAFSTSITFGAAGVQFSPEEYAEKSAIVSNFLSYPSSSHAALNRYITYVIGNLGVENSSTANLGRSVKNISSQLISLLLLFRALDTINRQLINGQNSGLRPNVRRMVLFSTVTSYAIFV